MLTIKNLSIKYIKQFYSLYNFSAELSPGDKLQLIGDELSGNAFVLRAVAGIDKFYSGTIVCDIDRNDFGYSPKKAVLFENKSVLFNLCYPNSIRHCKADECKKTAYNILTKYGYEYIADKLVSSLSNEDKYIVSLMRLCVRKVRLLLIEYIPSPIAQIIVNDLIENCDICIISCQKIENINTNKTIFMQNGSIKDSLIN